MATVKTPVAGFTGTVVGVHFEDGEGETEDPKALAYFTRQGYAVGETAPSFPEGAPTDKWTKKQLTDYLNAHGIEVPRGAKVADLLALVSAGEEIPAD